MRSAFPMFAEIGYRIKCLCFSLGKPSEYQQKIGPVTFSIRRNTSDLPIIREVWERRVYRSPSPGERVVDIGANIGAYTLFAAQNASHVYAFEPNPANFSQLKKNIAQVENVTAFDLAVGGTEGERLLTEPRVNHGSATLFGKNATIPVRCITLANLCSLCDIPTIDVLKIDAEGAEYEILLTSPQELIRRIRTITMEFHDDHTTHHHEELTTLLEKAGFTVEFKLPFCGLLQKGYLHATRTEQVLR